MKKLFVIALILLLLVPSSLGQPNEHSSKPEIIKILNPHAKCNLKIISFTTVPVTIKCFNFDFQV